MVGGLARLDRAHSLRVWCGSGVDRVNNGDVGGEALVRLRTSGFPRLAGGRKGLGGPSGGPLQWWWLSRLWSEPDCHSTLHSTVTTLSSGVPGVDWGVDGSG